VPHSGPGSARPASPVTGDQRTRRRFSTSDVITYPPGAPTATVRADMVTKSRAHAASKNVAGPWSAAGGMLDPFEGAAGAPSGGA